MTITTQAFFEALYPDGLDGAYLEIRKLPSAHQTFAATIEEAARASKDATQKQNVYFGMGLRRDRVGTEEAVTAIPALWGDVDWKDYEGDAKLAAAVIQAFELQPSIIVRSGHGYHMYWLLKEPETVTPENLPRLRGYLLGIAKAIGGDEKCRDLSRILRVPGTLNLKDPKNPRPVVVTKWEPEKRFNLSDFDAYFVEDAPAPGGAVGVPSDSEIVRAMAGGIKEHQGRDNAAYTVARRLAAKGVPKEEALALLSAWDTTNDPPLTKTNGPGILAEKAESAYKKAAETAAKNGKRSSSPHIGKGDGDNRSIVLRPRSAADLVQNTPEVAWIIEQILAIGRVLMMSGYAGACKTMAALALALAVEMGSLWLCRFSCRKGRVLYIDEENGDLIIRDRLVRLLRGLGRPEDGSDCEIQFLTMAGVDLSDEAVVGAIAAVLSEGRYDLVIIDTFFATNHADENSAFELRPILDILKGWMNAYGCAFCFLHHRRKPSAGGDDSQHAYRGSSALKAFVDSHLDMTPVKDKDGAANVRHVKARMGKPVEPFAVEVIDLPDNGLVVRFTEAQKPETTTRLEEAQTFILVLTETWERVTRKEITEKGGKAGFSEKLLDTARLLLVESGKLGTEKVGRETFVWRSEKPSSPSPTPYRGEDDHSEDSNPVLTGPWQKPAEEEVEI